MNCAFLGRRARVRLKKARAKLPFLRLIFPHQRSIARQFLRFDGFLAPTGLNFESILDLTWKISWIQVNQNENKDDFSLQFCQALA